MIVDKNLNIDWRKIEDSELAEVRSLDDICFEYKDMDYLREIEPKRGEIWRLYSHQYKKIIAYSVYGQLWDNNWNGNAYIMRIGSHPNHRRNGYASWIIKSIILELSRHETCPAVYCDISQSNQASINLFTKSGFKLSQVRNDIYPDGELSNCMYFKLR